MGGNKRNQEFKKWLATLSPERRRYMFNNFYKTLQQNKKQDTFKACVKQLTMACRMHLDSLTDDQISLYNRRISLAESTSSVASSSSNNDLEEECQVLDYYKDFRDNNSLVNNDQIDIGDSKSAENGWLVKLTSHCEGNSMIGESDKAFNNEYDNESNEKKEEEQEANQIVPCSTLDLSQITYKKVIDPKRVVISCHTPTQDLDLNAVSETRIEKIDNILSPSLEIKDTHFSYKDKWSPMKTSNNITRKVSVNCSSFHNSSNEEKTEQSKTSQEIIEPFLDKFKIISCHVSTENEILQEKTVNDKIIETTDANKGNKNGGDSAHLNLGNHQKVTSTGTSGAYLEKQKSLPNNKKIEVYINQTQSKYSLYKNKRNYDKITSKGIEKSGLLEIKLIDNMPVTPKIIEKVPSQTSSDKEFHQSVHRWWTIYKHLFHEEKISSYYYYPQETNSYDSDTVLHNKPRDCDCSSCQAASLESLLTMHKKIVEDGKYLEEELISNIDSDSVEGDISKCTSNSEESKVPEIVPNTIPSLSHLAMKSVTSIFKSHISEQSEYTNKTYLTSPYEAINKYLSTCHNKIPQSSNPCLVLPNLLNQNLPSFQPPLPLSPPPRRPPTPPLPVTFPLSPSQPPLPPFSPPHKPPSPTLSESPPPLPFQTQLLKRSPSHPFKLLSTTLPVSHSPISPPFIPPLSLPRPPPPLSPIKPPPPSHTPPPPPLSPPPLNLVKETFTDERFSNTSLIPKIGTDNVIDCQNIKNSSSNCKSRLQNGLKILHKHSNTLTKTLKRIKPSEKGHENKKYGSGTKDIDVCSKSLKKCPVSIGNNNNQNSNNGIQAQKSSKPKKKEITYSLKDKPLQNVQSYEASQNRIVTSVYFNNPTNEDISDFKENFVDKKCSKQLDKQQYEVVKSSVLEETLSKTNSEQTNQEHSKERGYSSVLANSKFVDKIPSLSNDMLANDILLSYEKEKETSQKVNVSEKVNNTSLVSTKSIVTSENRQCIDKNDSENLKSKKFVDDTIPGDPIACEYVDDDENILISFEPVTKKSPSTSKENKALSKIINTKADIPINDEFSKNNYLLEDDLNISSDDTDDEQYIRPRIIKGFGEPFITQRPSDVNEFHQILPKQEHFQSSENLSELVNSSQSDINSTEYLALFKPKEGIKDNHHENSRTLTPEYGKVCESVVLKNITEIAKHMVNPKIKDHLEPGKSSSKIKTCPLKSDTVLEQRKSIDSSSSLSFDKKDKKFSEIKNMIQDKELTTEEPIEEPKDMDQGKLLCNVKQEREECFELKKIKPQVKKLGKEQRKPKKDKRNLDEDIKCSKTEEKTKRTLAKAFDTLRKYKENVMIQKNKTLKSVNLPDPIERNERYKPSKIRRRLTSEMEFVYSVNKNSNINHCVNSNKSLNKKFVVSVPDTPSNKMKESNPPALDTVLVTKSKKNTSINNTLLMEMEYETGTKDNKLKTSSMKIADAQTLSKSINAATEKISVVDDHKPYNTPSIKKRKKRKRCSLSHQTVLKSNLSGAQRTHLDNITEFEETFVHEKQESKTNNSISSSPKIDMNKNAVHDKYLPNNVDVSNLTNSKSSNVFLEKVDITFKELTDALPSMPVLLLEKDELNNKTSQKQIIKDGTDNYILEPQAQMKKGHNKNHISDRNKNTLANIKQCVQSIKIERPSVKVSLKNEIIQDIILRSSIFKSVEKEPNTVIKDNEKNTDLVRTHLAEETTKKIENSQLKRKFSSKDKINNKKSKSQEVYSNINSSQTENNSLVKTCNEQECSINTKHNLQECAINTKHNLQSNLVELVPGKRKHNSVQEKILSKRQRHSKLLNSSNQLGSKSNEAIIISADNKSRVAGVSDTTHDSQKSNNQLSHNIIPIMKPKENISNDKLPINNTILEIAGNFKKPKLKSSKSLNEIEHKSSHFRQQSETISGLSCQIPFSKVLPFVIDSTEDGIKYSYKDILKSSGLQKVIRRHSSDGNKHSEKSTLNTFESDILSSNDIDTLQFSRKQAFSKACSEDDQQITSPSLITDAAINHNNELNVEKVKRTSTFTNSSYDNIPYLQEVTTKETNNANIQSILLEIDDTVADIEPTINAANKSYVTKTNSGNENQKAESSKREIIIRVKHPSLLTSGHLESVDFFHSVRDKQASEENCKSSTSPEFTNKRQTWYMAPDSPSMCSTQALPLNTNKVSHENPVNSCVFQNDDVESSYSFDIFKKNLRKKLEFLLELQYLLNLGKSEFGRLLDIIDCIQFDYILKENVIGSVKKLSSQNVIEMEIKRSEKEFENKLVIREKDFRKAFQGFLKYMTKRYRSIKYPLLIAINYLLKEKVKQVCKSNIDLSKHVTNLLEKWFCSDETRVILEPNKKNVEKHFEIITSIFKVNDVQVVFFSDGPNEVLLILERTISSIKSLLNNEDCNTQTISTFDSPSLYIESNSPLSSTQPCNKQSDTEEGVVSYTIQVSTADNIQVSNLTDNSRESIQANTKAVDVVNSDRAVVSAQKNKKQHSPAYTSIVMTSHDSNQVSDSNPTASLHSNSTSSTVNTEANMMRPDFNCSTKHHHWSGHNESSKVAENTYSSSRNIQQPPLRRSSLQINDGVGTSKNHNLLNNFNTNSNQYNIHSSVSETSLNINDKLQQLDPSQAPNYLLKSTMKDGPNSHTYNSTIINRRASKESRSTNNLTSIGGSSSHINNQERALPVSITQKTVGNTSYTGSNISSHTTTDGQSKILQTQSGGQTLDRNVRSQPRNQPINHTNRVLSTEQPYLVPNNQQVTTQANNNVLEQRVQTQPQRELFSSTSNVCVNNPTNPAPFPNNVQNFNQRLPHGYFNDYRQFSDPLTQEQVQFLSTQINNMHRIQSQNNYSSSNLPSTNKTSTVNTLNRELPHTLAQDFQFQTQSNVQTNSMLHYNSMNTPNLIYRPQFSNQHIQNNVFNQYGLSENVPSNQTTLPKDIRNQSVVSGRKNNHGINSNAEHLPDQLRAQNIQQGIISNPSHSGQVQQLTNFNPLMNMPIQTSPRRILSNDFSGIVGMNQITESDLQTIENILSNDEMTEQRNNAHQSLPNESTKFPGTVEPHKEPPQVLEQGRFNFQQHYNSHVPKDVPETASTTFLYKPSSNSASANDPFLASVLENLNIIFLRLANPPPSNIAFNNVSLTTEQMMDFLIEFRNQLNESGLVNGLETTLIGSFVSGGREFTGKELKSLSEGVLKMEQNIHFQQTSKESTNEPNSPLTNSTIQQDGLNLFQVIPPRGSTERKMFLREKRNIIANGLGSSMQAYAILKKLAEKGDADAKREIREVHQIALVGRAQKRMLQMETIEIDD